MFKNYIKIAFRNLWKNKGYGLLNISGLAIGIACAGLIFLWVEDEFTYNHYFENRDNLFKVKDCQTYDGTTYTFDATPGPFAQGIKSEIPGIQNAARTTWGNSVLFSLNDKPIYEQGLYVDAAFLSMFQLQFVQGNAQNAFNQLNSLVITETMASKFFGTDKSRDNLIGKTLKVDNKENYTISGVIKDLPKNVSFRFNWLSPFKIYEDQNKWLQKWGNNGVVTYVEKDPGANIETINKKLYNYVEGKQKGATAKMSIYPMNRWRMYDSFDNGKEIPGRIRYVNLFSLIAWIILIIACINFMNLATARSEQRAKEVGVRKVLGAGKRKLIGQFIGESIFTSMVATFFALIIIYISLPAFNSLVEKQLVLNISEPSHIAALVLLTFICGMIAGSYPAFYLSSFKPVSVLKGIKFVPSGNAGIIRKGLVVLQFAISIILIIATIIIYEQISYVKNRDLGYNKSNLVFMYLQGNIKEHFEVIKNDLQSTGFVQNSALSNDPVLQMGSNTGDFVWEGKDPSKQVLITVEGVSPEYASTMRMQLEAGRDFYPEGKIDSTNVIINESLSMIINKKNILGSTISQGDTKYTIVGILKDFVYNNMYGPAAPLVLFSNKSNCNVLSIRLKDGVQIPAALSAMETLMKKDNPGYPFDYNFIDQQFDQLFKTETLIGKLAGIFSILAIFISSLGLFGLAAYTAERRTKEIGIRKVLGAGLASLTYLISIDFLQLVFLACILAFPVAWWIMHNWLHDFEYRIQMSWWIFVAAGLLAIFIALVTVSFQAIRAAVANPVKSLRTE